MKKSLTFQYTFHQMTYWATAAGIVSFATAFLLQKGFAASVVAFFLQWGLYNFLLAQIANVDSLQLFSMVPFVEVIELVAAAYAIVGFVVGVFGSLLSIRKFLKV